jgi:hypothetical protein
MGGDTFEGRRHARLAGTTSRVQELWSFTITWRAGMIDRVIGRNDIRRGPCRRRTRRRGTGVVVNEDSTTPDLVRSRGRGKLSGVAIERRESHVWALRDRKLWRLRTYAGKDEAVKAVRLSE